MFPKIISAGEFFLPAYGVIVAIAFLTAIWLTGRLGRTVGLKPDSIMNLALYCALAGMAGAKLTMIAFDWPVYSQDPGRIFSLETLQAMGVYQGGLVLALLVAVLYIRSVALPGLVTADVFAPGIALGHGIGRLGCFAAGCCWGQSCDRPWAVTFTNPDAHQLTGVPLNVALHPTQLYEAFAEFLIFGLLYRRFHQAHNAGAIIGLYMLLYSLVRFLVEFVRNHEQALPFNGPLSITQYISLGTLLIGVWLTWRPAQPLARTFAK